MADNVGLNDSREELNRLRAAQLQMQMMGTGQNNPVKLAQDRLISTILHDTPKQTLQDVQGAMWQGKADTVGQTMLAGRPSTFVTQPIATALAGKALEGEVNNENNNLLSSIRINEVAPTPSELKRREIIQQKYTQKIKDITKMNLSPWEKKQYVNQIYNEFQNDQLIKSMYRNKDLYYNYMNMIDKEAKDLNLTGRMKEVYKASALDRFEQMGGTGDDPNKPNMFGGRNPSKVVNIPKIVNEMIDKWKANSYESEHGYKYANGQFFVKDLNKNSWEQITPEEVRKHLSKMVMKNPELIESVKQNNFVNYYQVPEEQMKQSLLDQEAKMIMSNPQIPASKKQDEINNVKEMLSKYSKDDLISIMSQRDLSDIVEFGTEKASYIKQATKSIRDFDYDEKQLHLWKKSLEESKPLVQAVAGATSTGEFKSLGDVMKQSNEKLYDAKTGYKSYIVDLLRKTKAPSLRNAFGVSIYTDSEVEEIMNNPNKFNDLMNKLTPDEQVNLSKYHKAFINNKTEYNMTSSLINEKINNYVEESIKNNPSLNREKLTSEVKRKLELESSANKKPSWFPSSLKADPEFLASWFPSSSKEVNSWFSSSSKEAKEASNLVSKINNEYKNERLPLNYVNSYDAKSDMGKSLKLLEESVNQNQIQLNSMDGKSKADYQQLFKMNGITDIDHTKKINMAITQTVNPQTRSVVFQLTGEDKNGKQKSIYATVPYGELQQNITDPKLKATYELQFHLGKTLSEVENNISSIPTGGTYTLFDNSGKEIKKIHKSTEGKLYIMNSSGKPVDYDSPQSILNELKNDAISLVNK